MSQHPFENVKHIFKAYDIRGLLEEVTPELAGAVGGALIDLTGAKTVVVGHDMRETSPVLLQAAINAITAKGANVKNIGLCSTSMFNYAATLEGIDAGLMITASHNPSEYNGIKAVLGGARPVSTQDLYEQIPKVTEGDGGGSVEQIEVLEDYLEKCISKANMPDLGGVKIAIDYGNGMGSLSMKPLIERLGIEVVELYPEPNARFPNHEANPAKESTLVDLKKLIKESGADFGVATDGDADRIGFVDNEGVMWSGDKVIMLLALKKNNEVENLKVTAPVNIGWSLDRQLEEIGVERIESRVGWSNVSEVMRKEGSQLGGEFANHFFFEEFGHREAIDYTFLLVLAAWRESGKKFSELTKELQRGYNSGEINLRVKDKEGTIQRVKDAIKDEATKVIEIDGLRCEFGEDWWFILRPSNTEPLLRLIAEANNEKTLKEKVAVMSELIGGEQEH